MGSRRNDGGSVASHSAKPGGSVNLDMAEYARPGRPVRYHFVALPALRLPLPELLRAHSSGRAARGSSEKRAAVGKQRQRRGAAAARSGSFWLLRLGVRYE